MGSLPKWIEDYYDGDIPPVEEDPSGPIATEGLSMQTKQCPECGVPVAQESNDSWACYRCNFRVGD